jgi:serine/threonine protein phosphatase PrpC
MNAERAVDVLLTIGSATLSEIGGRSGNQDRIGVAHQDELACFVVSDGVGGLQGGEVASGVVVDAILERVVQESLFGERALRAYVDFATARLAACKRDEPLLKDMSATVAAVLINRQNRLAVFAHLGDTRIYLFRHAQLHQVTKDHSLVQQFIDAGYCTPDQLRTHALRSTLFAAVGIESETPIEAVSPPVALEVGDALLICTDGFWEWLSDAAMEQAFADAVTVDDWLANMAAAAAVLHRASRKERDNASAIAIWVNAPQAVP